MNIVINYVGKKGGGPVYAYSMAKALIERGHKVYLITADNIENRKHWEKLKLSGILFVRGYTSRFSFVFRTILFRLFEKRKIKRYFKNIHLDASYHPMETLWGGMIDKCLKAKKYIVTIHDPIEHTTNNKYPLWLKNLLIVSDKKKMTDVVILSSCFVDTIKDRFGLNDDNVCVIKHGNFDYYFTICESPEYEYPKECKTHFLFFGRIDKYKGLHILSRAYESLSLSYSDIDLTIVGSGDFSEYENEYASLPRCKVINRWIKDEEIASFFLPENVVVVLPYIDATQSGVVPIALSAKKIIVASRTGGLVEQIEENNECLMFSPNNVIELRDAMERAIYEKHNEKILTAGKEKVDSLSWENSAKKLEEFILK